MEKELVRFDEKCPRTFWVGNRKFKLPEYWQTESVYFDDDEVDTWSTWSTHLGENMDNTWDLFDLRVDVVEHPLKKPQVLGVVVLTFKRGKHWKEHVRLHFTVDVKLCDDDGYSTFWELEDTLSNFEDLKLEDLEVKNV